MGLYWMKLVDTSLPGFHTLCKDDWVLQWREIVLQHLKLCQTWRGKAFSSRNVKPKVNEQVVVRKLELCQWLDSWTFSFFTVKGRQQLCTGPCWKGLTCPQLVIGVTIGLLVYQWEYNLVASWRFWMKSIFIPRWNNCRRWYHSSTVCIAYWDSWKETAWSQTERVFIRHSR